ncbi:unnamed protein product [Chrysoparadoxa australica]
MGSNYGKGVLIEDKGGPLPEEAWCHLGVVVEGRRVSLLVNGEVRGQGRFVGNRIGPAPYSEGSDSCFSEPLHLCARGSLDQWLGNLFDLQIWGGARTTQQLREDMLHLPPEACVERPPPACYAISTGPPQDLTTIRVDAPASAACPTTLYYEVELETPGDLRVGWALPSFCPPCPAIARVGVGDDDSSWALDSRLGYKWHGSTVPTQDPCGNGLPYCDAQQWKPGDVIGCSLDMEQGSMAFSHNGSDLGVAFLRDAVRYRVVGRGGVNCYVAPSRQAEVLEHFAAGTVLWVHQVEMGEDGIQVLRLAEGWVFGRSLVDDEASSFELVKLLDTTDAFAGKGIGEEGCVFADTFHGDSTASLLGTYPEWGGTTKYWQQNQTCTMLEAPPPKHVPGLAADARSGSSTTSSTMEAHDLVCLLRKGEPAPQGVRNAILARSLDVGNSRATTTFAQLWLPLVDASDASIMVEQDWQWGLILGDAWVYLSLRGGNAYVHAMSAEAVGSTLILPISWTGHWINFKVEAFRSGENTLTVTPVPNASDSDNGSENAAGLASQHDPLQCTFENAFFFRGERTGCLALHMHCSGCDAPMLPHKLRNVATFLGAGPGTTVPATIPDPSRLKELKDALHQHTLKLLEEPLAVPELSSASHYKALCKVELPRATIRLWEPYERNGYVSFGTCVTITAEGGAHDAHGQRRDLVAVSHPYLVKPVRYERFPWKGAARRRQLYAWLPVPPSEDFVVLGMVFTMLDEPPPLDRVRCVHRQLASLVDEDEREALQFFSMSPQHSSSHNELVLIRSTGLVMPRSRSSALWGIAGDYAHNKAKAPRDQLRRGGRWEGLLPAFSWRGRKQFVINIGHKPFKYMPGSSTPLCQNLAPGARLVLQCVNCEDWAWEDVTSKHGLTSAELTCPLVGRWRMASIRGKQLMNEVIGLNGKPLPSGIVEGPVAWDETVLPPARGLSGIWGMKLTVKPVFPEVFQDVPRLRDLFSQYTANMWGSEKSRAAQMALNAKIVRFVNAQAAKNGIRGLAADWSRLLPTAAALAAWEESEWSAKDSSPPQQQQPYMRSHGAGGVEEMKESMPGEGRHSEGPLSLDADCNFAVLHDVWELPSATATGSNSKACLSYGQVVRLAHSQFGSQSGSQRSSGLWGLRNGREVELGSAAAAKAAPGPVKISGFHMQAQVTDCFSESVQLSPVAGAVPWLPMIGGGDDPANLSLEAPIALPKPCSLVSAHDVQGPGEAVVITGLWTVGLVTDLLGVLTRTSGCIASGAGAGGGAALKSQSDTRLLDGVACVVQPVDGAVMVTLAPLNPNEEVNHIARANLGHIEPGSELAFSVVDTGSAIYFAVSELHGSRRHAAVHCLCDESSGRGRVALTRATPSGPSPKGWLRIVSEEHSATVRGGVSIDASVSLGQIPQDTVVRYDDEQVYTTPQVECHPVTRFHVLATEHSPDGWISSRGRYVSHPYAIAEKIEPDAPGAGVSVLLSYLTIGIVHASEVEHFATLMDQAGQTTGPTTGPTTGEISQIASRMELIQKFNLTVQAVLPYVNFKQVDRPWSLARKVSDCRLVLYSVLKQELWEAALKETACAAATGNSLPDLKLSRARAASSVNLIKASDREGNQTLFSQAFRQLRGLPSSAFRIGSGDSLYNTIFLGEHAHDAGGPYRETFAQYCSGLQSSQMTLLIQCPNIVNNAGSNRDKWLPSPSADSPTELEMFHFLGRLMGLAIRTKLFLDLNFPSLVWKQLVGQLLTRDDLENVDVLFTNSMDSIREMHVSGITEEVFDDLGIGMFTCVGCDGKVSELKPGGSSIPVTYRNCLEYAELAEAHRLHENHKQVMAIRDGLADVVPLASLALFTWQELEELVCGQAEIDVDLLESCTEYSACSANDAHVRYFWQALRGFDQVERSLFLRFAWGRSRLPINADQFKQRFKIQSFTKSSAAPDEYLPEAHTCFFCLELPAYSSAAVTVTKLRYAIYNCQAIDADDTSIGRNAANMGFSEYGT